MEVYLPGALFEKPVCVTPSVWLSSPPESSPIRRFSSSFCHTFFCRFAFLQKTGQSPAFEETATSLPSLPLPIYPMASVSHVGGGHPTTPVCIFNTLMVGRSPAWRKKSRELAAAEPFFATHGKEHVLSCQFYVVRVVFGGGETINKWLRVILFQLSSIVLHL